MKRVYLTFPCGDIRLEGCWHFPESAVPVPAVVVCHPHPLHGGNMNNNVVFAICQKLAENSIAALRFNFRGVGSSGGAYGEGVGEQEDVWAALALAAVTAGIDASRLGLAGYSFGGRVALAVATEDKMVERLALVSPALGSSGWAQLKNYSRPLYVIHGEHDIVITTDLVQQYLVESKGLRHYEVIESADHFLMGYEAVIAEKVADFFTAGFEGT